MLARYAKQDTVADLSAGPWARLGRVFAGAKLAGGRGGTPAGLWAGPVEAARLFEDAGPLPDGSDELFGRYVRVKLAGNACCGPAFEDWPLTEGFFALALVYPLAVTLGRWRMLAEGRDRLSLEDVRAGLRLADHHHGYDPGTVGPVQKRQVRQLQAAGDLAKLIARGGR